MTLASPPFRLTAEDLLSLPDNGGMEFVHGQIAEKQVSELAARTESQINFLFMLFVRDNPVARVYPQSMGFQCFQMLADDPELMRRPDVAVVRTERYRALKDPNPGYMPIPPDLAVEVLSANDLFSNVNRKLTEYRLAGFPTVWIVDPVIRTVTIYTNPGKPVILTDEDTIDAPNALPGFSCKVAELFPAA